MWLTQAAGTGLLLASVTYAGVIRRDLTNNPPTAALDSATVTGYNEDGLSKFLGIRFAEAPYDTYSASLLCLLTMSFRKGNLRFNNPQPITSYSDSINATSYGFSCPQQTAKFPISFKGIFNFTIPFLKNANESEQTSQADPDDPPEDEDCRSQITSYPWTYLKPEL